MSELKPFIEDRCKIGPREWDATSVLYDAYNDWCEKHRMVPLDTRQFAQRLGDYGCRPKSKRLDTSKNPVRGWLGIRLRFDSETKSESELFTDDEGEENEDGLQKFA